MNRWYVGLGASFAPRFNKKSAVEEVYDLFYSKFLTGETEKIEVIRDNYSIMTIEGDEMLPPYCLKVNGVEKSLVWTGKKWMVFTPREWGLSFEKSFRQFRSLLNWCLTEKRV